MFTAPLRIGSVPVSTSAVDIREHARGLLHAQGWNRQAAFAGASISTVEAWSWHRRIGNETGAVLETVL